MALTAIFPTQAIVEGVQTSFFLMSIGDGVASTTDVPVVSGSPDGVAILHDFGWDQANTANQSDVNITRAFDGTLTVNSGSVATGTTLFVNIHIKDIIGYQGEYTTAGRDALNPTGNPTIYNTETGTYQRYESAAWADKGGNFQQAGVVIDVFSQIKLTVSASGTGGGTGGGTNTNTNPITFDALSFNNDFAGTRRYFPPGSTLDLSPYIDNQGGTGTLVVDDASISTVNITNAQVSINQTTYVATFNKPANSGDFALEWGIVQ